MLPAPAPLREGSSRVALSSHRTGDVGGVGTDAVAMEARLLTMQRRRRREALEKLPHPTPPAADDVWAGADQDYATFVEAHAAELGRLAYLMTGDRDGADDLLADAMLATWQSWDRVRAAQSPLAYVRGMVVKMAATRVRRLVRERAHLVLMRADARAAVESDRDVPAVVDVRAALRRMPDGQRACVVLRHGLGLSEEETARTLGISVGTVKSQTSKGAARLRGLLAASALDEGGRR